MGNDFELERIEREERERDPEPSLDKVYCQPCRDHHKWTIGCDGCDHSTCIKNRNRIKKEKEEWETRRREREERKRREEERLRREREERKRREEEILRREEEKRRREEEERQRREEEAEERAQNNLGSLLNSISYKINGINLGDLKINTSMINRKSVYLQKQRVSNLSCSMNTVGSAYSESIDTSLKRERIFEQKNNYLYKETDELSLENLKTLVIKKEKIRFTKKF